VVSSKPFDWDSLIIDDESAPEPEPQPVEAAPQEPKGFDWDSLIVDEPEEEKPAAPLEQATPTGEPFTAFTQPEDPVRTPIYDVSEPESPQEPVSPSEVERSIMAVPEPFVKEEIIEEVVEEEDDPSVASINKALAQVTQPAKEEEQKPPSRPSPNFPKEYAGAERIYSGLMMLYGHPDVTEQEIKDVERLAAAAIVEEVFVDATRNLTGNRALDDVVEKRDVEGQRVDPIVEFFATDTQLEDREDYAEFAVYEMLRRLHEVDAPNSVIHGILEEYEKAKDHFDDLTAEDVWITGEGARNYTTKAAQQGLNAILFPVLGPMSAAVAAAAGKPRNPGEPNDSIPFLHEATSRDLRIFRSPNLPKKTRMSMAQKIAGRSYQPRPEKPSVPWTWRSAMLQFGETQAGTKLPGAASASDAVGKSVRMQPPDILYIMQEKVSGEKSAWAKGLKKHIKKRINELAPTWSVERLSRRRKRYFDSAPSVEKVYNYLKDFAAVSYVDALDSEYGEYLEGYDPIKPPKGGWAYQKAERMAEADARQYRFSSQESGSTAMGNVRGMLDSPEARYGYSATPLAIAGRIKRHPSYFMKDALEAVNTEELKKAARDGVFGKEAQKNPNAAVSLFKASELGSGKHNYVLNEWAHNMSVMMGAFETARFMTMSVAGARKYGLPALIPFVETGGVLSADTIDMVHNEDLSGLMEDLHITEEDVDLFWKENPGFGVLGVASVTVPAAKAVKPAYMGVSAVGGAFVDMARAKKNGVSIFEATRKFSESVKERFTSLQEEVGPGAEVRTGETVKEIVIQSPPEEAVPLDQTATTLRNLAKKDRDKADVLDPSDSATKSHRESADALDAAADALSEANRVKEMEQRKKATYKEAEDITPTVERITPAGPTRSGADMAPSAAGFERKVKSVAEAIAGDKKKKRDNKSKKKYRSPGRRAFVAALKAIALELGYERVTPTFKADHVVGKADGLVKRFIENGVTDPLAYLEIFLNEKSNHPNAGITIPAADRIANWVMSAETSRFSALKAEFHQAMKRVAEIRNVKVEDVYNDTYMLNVADDFAKNGVQKRELYALLGLSDAQIKEYMSLAKQHVEKPVVKRKPFGENVLPVQDEVVAQPPMTAGKAAVDLVTRAPVRVLAGKRGANIIANRAKAVQGKSTLQKALPMAEASLLATFEFFESPFAMVNFPSYVGDFFTYLYENSTGKSGFQKAMRFAAGQLISPSAKVTPAVYDAFLAEEGRVKNTEFEIKKMAERLGDVDEQAALSRIAAALEEVGLGDQTPGAISGKGKPGTISAEQVHNFAMALLNSYDDASILIPSDTAGGLPQRVFLKDLFVMEYKTADGWINAMAASDEVGALRAKLDATKTRIGEIEAQQKDLRAQQVKSHSEKGAADPLLSAELEALKKEKRELSSQREADLGTIKAIKEHYGTAADVFQLVDGRVTGVHDIRFTFNPKYEGPIGDVAKTLLGIANSHVRPERVKFMERAANLAVGEKTFRLSVAAPRSRHSVLVKDVKTGKVETVKTFKGKGSKEKATKMADKINKDYKGPRQEKGQAAPDIAQVSTELEAAGGRSVVGKRDLTLEGYDAVAKTAGHLSAFFMETEFINFLHSIMKERASGKLSAGEMAARFETVATMIKLMYPESVIRDIVKKSGKKNPTDMQIALKIMEGLEDGTVMPISAKGSGQIFRERLWAKALKWDQRKDFYAAYQYAVEQAHMTITRRLEHYKLLNFLREKGLILTKSEIEATGLQSHMFREMSQLAKEYPGLIDNVPNAYVAANVVDSLVQQQRLMESFVSTQVQKVAKEGKWLNWGVKGEGPLSEANRQMKRMAIVSFLNGTMARNYIGGVVVQAQMADIPGTMIYTRKAAEANRAIRNGEAPSDPVFRELSDRLGGPNRKVQELGVDAQKTQTSAQAAAQMEYILDSLSPQEGEGIGMGEAVSQQLSSQERQLVTGLTQVMDPDNKASRRFAESLNLVEDVAGAPPKGTVIEPLTAKQIAKRTKDFLAYLSKKGTTIYGSIDDVLRLSYAYELVKKHGLSPEEACRRAREVFYDYPDLPPVAQALRDAPLVGIPFMGYVLWSTKAYGNFFQNNPLRAAVMGAFSRGLQESAERTVRMASSFDLDLFDGATGQELKSLFPMPAVTARRTTEAEQAKLHKAGVPREEQGWSIAQPGFDTAMMGVGVQADQYLWSPAMKAEEKKDMNITEYLGAAVFSQRSMLGSVLGRMGLTYADSAFEKLREAEGVEDTGLFEGALETAANLGYSDARGAAKIVSASSDRPFAGQDADVMTALTNGVGLAMKALDPRIIKHNYSDIGQRKMSKLQADLDEMIRSKQSTVGKKGLAFYDAKLRLILRDMSALEKRKDLFKRGLERDGVRLNNNIFTLIRAAIKHDPYHPSFERSFKDLLTYFNVEENEIRTNLLEK
jgi:hypothetical protein